jgi:hypothetical protein
VLRVILAATVLALAVVPCAQALERATTDRPDDTTAPQIHLMYVVPSDGADRGFDVNGTIVDSTMSWERWLAGQTGGLELRLDTFMGQPDVTFVRLPESDAQMAARVQYVRDEIEIQLHALGFAAPHKIYAVFYDGTDVGGITCPSACAASLREGTTVTLTATALAGYRFDGWSGACSGKAGCMLTLTADTSVGASFSAAPKPPPKPKAKPKKRKRR